MPHSADKKTASSDFLHQLDPLLQNRTRLGIAVLLADTESVSFSGMKQLLEETDGNLGASLRKLEDAGYIAVKKEFVDRKPVSWYSLTAKGRQVLTDHVEALEKLIRDVKKKG